MIYEHYEQPLLRTARRILRQQQDAEDAVQSTFLKLYRGIGRFQYRSKFSSYLFRILLNTCFDSVDKKKRRAEEPLEWSNPSSEEEYGTRLDLEDAIGRLPERMRNSFVLFAVEGFKQEEIADILNMKLGTVKANIFHAKSRLRTLLSGSEKEAQT
jgi:RNA polymerase sigma-70 factor (ECF subfamily)